MIETRITIPKRGIYISGIKPERSFKRVQEGHLNNSIVWESQSLNPNTFKIKNPWLKTFGGNKFIIGESIFDAENLNAF